VSQSYDIKAYPVEVDYLEMRMVVLMDIKMEISYFKSEGTWAWHSRGDDNIDNWHCGFESWWEAVLDATDPYFQNED
jgi:hypothetical protein